MWVSSATSTSASSSTSLEGQQLSSDDFLTLLVAQLTHQDPLEPMEGQELMAQIAQLETVVKLDELNDYLQASNQLTNPLSTLGRTVFWHDSAGELRSGQVTAVAKDGTGAFKLVVGEEWIDFSVVERIE